MSLQFVLGGSGRGKTYYMQHFIQKEAKLFPQRQYIYLVPEQFTMQTQKELIQISQEKGLLNIDVQSFVRLAFRVFSETGANNMPVLDDMGKSMILKKVLANMEEDLHYFGRNVHKKGYVQEMKSFLSELFQYGVDEEVLEEMIQSSQKHPVLVQKLQDVKLIYKRFVEYLKEHYITSEEVMTVLAQVAQESKLLQDSVVCLDGFTGFTPTQYQFIEKLLRVCRKVYVSVTIHKDCNIAKVGYKHQLFHMSQQTICRLRRLAQENGVEVCEEIWTGDEVQETRFSKAEGICKLEENLFRYPFTAYQEITEDISIHVLKQPENELEFVAEQIKKLLEEEKCRYRDIAVITGDMDIYGILAKEVFAKGKIPCFIDQKKSILANPFVALISQMLDVFSWNFHPEKVMAYKKNLFSTSTREENDLLDNFLRATGIRGYKKWQEVWNVSKVFYGLTKEETEKIGLEIDTIRLETVEELGELYEQIGKGKHTVRHYAQCICQWLEEGKYYYAIEEMVDRFTKENERELAKEYAQIYQIVLDVMDRLVELLGDEVMDMREFREILDTGFSEARIGLIPPGVDQIVVGDRDRTRLAHVKYLFFVGMNDCNIGKGGAKGGVISDSERIFLSDREFELAPTIRDQVYTDQFYLYLSLTKPSRHLYLTYCETGNDGRAQNPAYIIDRVRKIFPELSVTVEENRQDDGHILGNDLGMGYFIQGIRKGNFTDPKWREIFSYYKRDCGRREILEKIIHAGFYEEEKSQLSQEVTKALYHDTVTGSTSQFERYAACAFSYFMRYGLGLRERQEHEVEFFDIGNIVHDALKLYTKRLIKEKKNWGDISEKEQHIRANECINQIVEEYRNGLLYDTERDTYLITRLRRIMARTVWAITEQMKVGEFSTVDSEVSFSILEQVKGSQMEERMERENEKDYLRLIGRIDRVDQMEGQDAFYVKVVDYKTGKKNISLSDLYYGLQMQLMIYLKASVEERGGKTQKIVIPAGVFYYHIDDPVIEGKKAAANIESEILKELRMDGLVNEDDPILPSMDSNLETENGELPVGYTSYVIPLATDKKGHLKKISKTVTTDMFTDLMEYTDDKLKNIRNEIMAGNIDVNPYEKMDGSGESACQYCPYGNICRFDTKIQGNRYRILKKLSDDDVMYQIRKYKEEKGGNNE